jgi:hypothetical protein
MCLENKRVFDVCKLGMSTARGQLFYETPESIFPSMKHCKMSISRFFCLFVIVRILLKRH